MSFSPKVSVVLTVFNSIKFIEKSIRDILNQTFLDFELLIVDDFSIDGTSQLVQELIKNDSRCFYIRNSQNYGPGFSRNEGLKVAKGEYIIFLDDDDIFDINLLKLSYDSAKESDSDLVVFKSYEVDYYDNNKKTTCNSIYPELLNIKENFSLNDVKNNIFESFSWWTWDKLIRKSVIDRFQISFQNLRSTDDLFFTFVTTFNCNTIKIIDQYLIGHVVSRKNSVSNSREKSASDVLVALAGLKTYLESIALYDKYKKDFIQYSITFLKWHVMTISDRVVQRKFYLEIKEFLIKLNFHDGLGLLTSINLFIFTKMDYNVAMLFFRLISLVSKVKKFVIK